MCAQSDIEARPASQPARHSVSLVCLLVCACSSASLPSLLVWLADWLVVAGSSSRLLSYRLALVCDQCCFALRFTIPVGMIVCARLVADNPDFLCQSVYVSRRSTLSPRTFNAIIAFRHYLRNLSTKLFYITLPRILP